ncbi:tripartite motif-containing protein 65 isoform X2 [Psammomys obesus]|uniref:tripartite motif-containing protein 65 isoform X2 n=1 Tax=Psammomys obesus TaxID=48139 RepID=UPI002452BBC2|nr:tripartite motif-containing protein 65 isoform X2 [Psammomys obesus]
MAAQLLEEDLTCSICLGRYRDPVSLPCGHSFCANCIQDSWRCCEEKTCPQCRQPFPEGPKLGRNLALSALLQALPTAIPRQEPGARRSAHCPHHGRPLEFFCHTEGLCVCSACTVHECRHHERALLDVERRAREDQLRARVAVTQQQVTQAESQLQELQQQSSWIENSACTLASVVSKRFCSLLQVLEEQQTKILRDIEVAKKQALGQVLNEEQRLAGHLKALAQYGHSVQDLLEQVDDYSFFQGLQQLSEPLESLGPLTPPQWNEEQQLNSVNELLSPLCELLLEEKNHAKVATKTADTVPVDYRNLTFDPDTANQYLRLSHKDRQVTHHLQVQGPARPGSFELWQVQCTQSFQTGRHYWEVYASDHSVTLGITYPKLPRRKLGTHTDNIGRGPCSWGLSIQEDNIQAWHNGKVQRLRGVPGRLLGVDLNLTVGCLTFYSLEPHTEPLHTFHAVFSQPLFPVFWLLEGRTLTLRHQPEAKLPPGPREETTTLS